MLYIVRHCRTDWNELRKVQGRTDVPLNATGRKQAEELALRFADKDFAEVYSSPLSRAAETARIISGRKPVTDERLSERLFGALEGQSKESEQFTAFWSLDDELKMLGTETIDCTAERVREVTDELIARSREKDVLAVVTDELIARSREKDVLAVTHGGVLMVLNYILKGRPAGGNLTEYLPDNAEITVW